MPLDRQTGEYSFANLTPFKETLNKNLSKTDRDALRILADEGGPLWKIAKSFLDYADEMKDAMARTPLTSEDNIRAARDAQVAYITYSQLFGALEDALDDPITQGNAQ